MFHEFITLVRKGLGVGPVTASQIYLYQVLGVRRFIHKGPRHTIIRPFDSDMEVYGQVFHARDYDLGERRTEQMRGDIERRRAEGLTPVIIDGGANVGYSAMFFADMYPSAIILAVEPDQETFAILVQNCASFPNIRPVLGALWKHDDGVNLQNTDLQSWARKVGDIGSTPSFTIETLLSSISNASLVLLKLDIEGAEVEVVEHSAATIANCPCVVIEPHDWMLPDSNSMAPFFRIYADRQIDTVVHGENLIFFDTAHLNKAPQPMLSAVGHA